MIVNKLYNLFYHYFFSYTIKQKRGLLVYFVLFVLILFLVIFFKNEEISKKISEKNA
mgnify:CR=1 FL=1